MSPRTQDGMALVAALFLIVVLAALGIFAVRIGGDQQQAVNLSLLQARALAVANSGIEFGANQALTANNCVNSTLTPPALAGFSVQVTCHVSDHQDIKSSATYHVYYLDAYAQYGAFGSADFVFRHVNRTVTNWP